MTTNILELASGDRIVHPGRPTSDPVEEWTITVGTVERAVAGDPDTWTVWYAEANGPVRWGLNFHADDTVELIS